MGVIDPARLRYNPDVDFLEVQREMERHLKDILQDLKVFKLRASLPPEQLGLLVEQGTVMADKTVLSTDASYFVDTRAEDDPPRTPQEVQCDAALWPKCRQDQIRSVQ